MILEINNQKSIQETLKILNSGDVLILDDGIYNEKVEIWNHDITIKAKNTHQAIIKNKDYYHKIMPNHNECNTFNTFTLYVGGDNVNLDGLIIENEATPSSIYGQAVSLHVDGNYFLCQNCQIVSAQDTLFTGPLPDDLQVRYKGFYPAKRLTGKPSIQHYENCIIKGDVDFIFGGATALFENCKIITINRLASTPSYICAPSHKKETPFGFLFLNCDLNGTSPTYLARPWRDYGCAAFINCKMDKHIIKAGYNKWNNTNRDKTARFFEYSNNTKDREPWVKILTADEAKEYVHNFKEFIHL